MPSLPTYCTKFGIQPMTRRKESFAQVLAPFWERSSKLECPAALLGARELCNCSEEKKQQDSVGHIIALYSSPLLSQDRVQLGMVIQASPSRVLMVHHSVPISLPIKDWSGPYT